MTSLAGVLDAIRPSPAPPARTAEALRCMAVPALVVEVDGLVSAANVSAMQVLGLSEPDGYTLGHVLAGWQGAEALLPVPQPGAAASPLRSGARVLECEVRPLPGEGVVLTLTDMSAHTRAIEEAQRDKLTRLLDRSALHTRITAALAEDVGAAGGRALLCIDLDRFKTVNDTLGHPIGDALLRKIAERLRRATRAGDAIARLGGDEFAVLQGGPPDPRAAELLAARLVDLLGRTYLVDGHMLNVGASVGVARLGPDGTDPDTLLRNADLALYQAKSDGRGTFRLFRPEMNDRLQARRLLELDLRRALALKEFELVYQPQVRAADKEIAGFEALLRWQHPTRGAISPGEFIPLAEEIGLMPAIGEWVLRTACREAARWPLPVSVAVNLSPLQFRDANLAELVVSALAHSGLPASRLELEITEGALLENTEAVVSILGRLSDLGVQTSMDDFGTGYSSLSYLQKFRFDKIKIDQSFVRQIGISADSTAIVRAVAALGASLGMKTTAEGVETAEQLAHIRAEGCTEIQGYLTGRPMTAAAALALMTAPAAELHPGDPR